ncbi:D-alanine--D-alanine ligase [Vagococcus lutrae]|uniref:D-alanine--D-alanine ligase n=2 Tax=Vagococcus lutrae TaxID=81947 RepID=V6Q5Z1_9ENTE|nr:MULTISPECIES: D-alanine--D-alanine ligase [Vagococcus]EST90182.1 D-alanine-D-alanine ligase [Vagococcus lutrae LBD1]MCO7150291.1 D-alanine--D-alanine ligase [Vagococcus lutrae]MDO5742177.1 D-alanine--D-alanine ligase [Vagococcus sp.]MDT2801325.1 D-alanine--D-alanine ligase [Vagococcus lutrae]MDT2805743.1 D-alanine--D-alanine ligase [Vagococcus lutrae]
MKIIALYGGQSAEHEISILTAYSMLQAFYYNYYQVQLVYITREGQLLKGPLLTEAPKLEEDLHLTVDNAETISFCDLVEEDTLVFPMLHGPNGEDGKIQGMLETLNMPYVGAGVLASACAMDKIMTKLVLQQIGIPQLPFVAVTKNDWRKDQEEVFRHCEGSLVYPMFVKPANLGSSVGISKAENQEELKASIDLALQYDHRVVVEQGIEAREIEIAVLGNEEVRTTLAGEIVKTVDFYDYDAKYINNDVTLQIPADIPEEIHEQARAYAEKAYLALDGSGLSRCDFFLTNNHDLFLNELNTMPGFTPFSMYPLLWQEMGLKYGDLIEELIQLGLMRHQAKQRLSITHQ